MHVILFILFFNSKNHYNYPVRKAIWIRASKLPFLNCLYQKLNSIKFHNFDNEQYCSLSAVLLNAAGYGCLERQDYRGKRQALPSECPSAGCSGGGPTGGPHLLSALEASHGQSQGPRPATDRHCPCIGEHTLIACLLACISQEGELLRTGPGASSTSEPLHRPDRSTEDACETTADKVKGNAHVSDPALPVLEIILQIYSHECTKVNALERPHV